MITNTGNIRPSTQYHLFYYLIYLLYFLPLALNVFSNVLLEKINRSFLWNTFHRSISPSCNLQLVGLIFPREGK